MELPTILIPHRRSKKKYSYNHFFNKVSYSADKDQIISNTQNIERSLSLSKSLKASKSLRIIRIKDKEKQSLASKMEERMKIRRAINLEKIFEDNTKMFARIYTQKSEYRYQKINPELVKKPYRSHKQNIRQQSVQPYRSKMSRMRLHCVQKQKTTLPYIKQGLRPLNLNEVSRSEGVRFQ